MRCKLGGVVVKKCIVAAMAVMMLGNSVLAVRAEENVEIQQDNDTAAYGQDTDSTDGGNAQGTDSADGGNAQDTDSADGGNAQDTDSADGGNIQGTDNENVQTVNTGDGTEQPDAEEVEAADAIQSKVDETEQEVKDSLVTVTGEDGEEQYEVIVGEKTKEDGSTATVTMKDYVEAQTQIAENARTELERALDENADDGKIAEYAEAVREAAKDVYNAAYLAEMAFSNAETKLKDEIKKYNACAKAYGYELISYNGEVLEYTQAEQEQFKAEAGLTQETEENRQEYTESVETNLEEQKDKIEKAQQTVEDARDTYESAQQAAQGMQQGVQAAQAAVQNAGTYEGENGETAASNDQTRNQDTPAEPENALEDMGQAQQKYDTAKKELDDVIMSVSEAAPNLSSLRMELTRKIAAMNVARQDLYKVREEKKTAIGYTAWAEQLVKASENKVVTGVYGQLVGTKTENAEFSYGNDKGFDKGDDNVITRDEINFAQISETTDIVVPYDIFKAYVKGMYDYRTADGKLVLYGEKDKRIGLGISSTDNGTMKKIFWKYDTVTKKIIPETMFVMESEEDELPDWMTQEGSVYFAGYTFKQENDGYHIDGHLCKASAPDTPDTPDKPDTPDTPNTPDTPVQNSDITSGNTVTIPDAITPLADGSTIIPDEDVPLASTIEPDNMIIVDEPVPLSDTVPGTGDDPRTEYGFLLAGVSAILAAVVCRTKKKK